MKRSAAALFAMLVGVAFAGAASARVRHDEKPYNAKKAAATPKDTAKASEPKPVQASTVPEARTAAP